MRRSVDVQFDSSEKLWRGVELKGVHPDGSLKPSALRLQVSVVRERHGQAEAVRRGKFNGVYEVTAARAVASGGNAVAVTCIDDPLDEQPGHALLAFSCHPGETITEQDIAARRQELANGFVQLIRPTKID
jgi:hypothetical protein